MPGDFISQIQSVREQVWKVVFFGLHCHSKDVLNHTSRRALY